MTAAAPQFTVILPTRERAYVLRYALQTVLDQDTDGVEIIVSDNCSEDGTRDMVESLGDPRIVYRNTGKRLSMSKNWEFALSHATGEWVTVVGDDDGLLPGCLSRVAELAATHQVEAIRSQIGSYLWPMSDETPYGTLTVTPKAKGTESRDSRQWLNRLLDGKELATALPMLYTGGFVKRSLIERVKEIDGIFYHSMNPDIYSAIACSCVTPRYLYVRELLAIGGASKYSNGASANKPSRLGTQRSAFQTFLSEPNIPFHTALPSLGNNSHLRNTTLLNLESVLQAIDAGLCTDLDVDWERQARVVMMTAKRRLRGEAKVLSDDLRRLHALPAGGTELSLEGVGRRLAQAWKRWKGKQAQVRIDGSAELPLATIHDACRYAHGLKGNGQVR